MGRCRDTGEGVHALRLGGGLVEVEGMVVLTISSPGDAWRFLWGWVAIVARF